MQLRELANKLSDNIRKRPTKEVVLETFNILCEETENDYDKIDEIIHSMGDQLAGIDIINEQFENKEQLNAMSLLHQMVANAKNDTDRDGNSAKKKQ